MNKKYLLLIIGLAISCTGLTIDFFFKELCPVADIIFFIGIALFVIGIAIYIFWPKKKENKVFKP